MPLEERSPWKHGKSSPLLEFTVPHMVWSVIRHSYTSFFTQMMASAGDAELSSAIIGQSVGTATFHNTSYRASYLPIISSPSDDCITSHIRFSIVSHYLCQGGVVMKRFTSMGLCMLFAISLCSTAADVTDRNQIKSRHVSKGADLFTNPVANVFTNKVATVRSLQNEPSSDCTFIVTIEYRNVTEKICKLVKEFDIGEGEVSMETVLRPRTCTSNRCPARRLSFHAPAPTSLQAPAPASLQVPAPASLRAPVPAPNRPSRRRSRRSLQTYNYPGAGYVVVTATDINCTSLEEQLRNSIAGVSYVESDVLGYIVSEPAEGQVSE
jgi:hypothetical protein